MKPADLWRGWRNPQTGITPARLGSKAQPLELALLDVAAKRALFAVKKGIAK